jgi:hypothetical protein
MTISLSTLCRNARLDAISTYAGGTAKLNVYQLTTGSSAPAADTNAVPGTLLAAITNPATYMGAASGGSAVKSGTWSDTSADAAGTAAFFRLVKNDGTTVVLQGTVGTAAADMIVDNAVFAAGQTFTVTTFTLTDGNS